MRIASDGAKSGSAGILRFRGITRPPHMDTVFSSVFALGPLAHHGYYSLRHVEIERFVRWKIVFLTLNLIEGI